MSAHRLIRVGLDAASHDEWRPEAAAAYAVGALFVGSVLGLTLWLFLGMPR